MISFEPLFRTMQEKGITSYRLEKMGLDRKIYYNMKRGKSVSTNTIDLLCHILQCKVEDIILHVEPDESPDNQA